MSSGLPPSGHGRASGTLSGARRSKGVPILPAQSSEVPDSRPAPIPRTQILGPASLRQQNPINFQFVNLTDPEIDANTRRTINAHVQRVDRQRKRWEKIKKPLENRERFPGTDRCRCLQPSVDIAAADGDSGPPKRTQICTTCGGQVLNPRVQGQRASAVRPEGGRYGRPSQSLLHILGQGRANPFRTYPIDPDPETDMLVDFFAQFIIPTHLAFGEKQDSPYLTQVVPTSYSDAAPFHGLLLSAAFYMFQATGQMRFAHLGMHHLGAGMRSINRSLGDPRKAVTNANITAVLYMIAFELANGDHNACQYHIRGLAQMVALRAGIDNENFGFLRNQIMWADRMGALLLGSRPYFLPTKLPQSPQSDSTASSPQSSTTVTPEHLNVGFRFLLERDDSRPELIRGLDMLCEKISILSTTEDPAVWMKHIGPFSEENIKFEYLLLHSPGEPISAMSDFEAIMECCRVAAQAFFTAINEARPQESAVIQSLGVQLRGRIEQINFNRCLGIYGEVLLWILYAGSYRVMGSIRSWFVALLPIVYARLGIETWETCLECLKKFVFLDRIKSPCLQLWADSTGDASQGSKVE